MTSTFLLQALQHKECPLVAHKGHIRCLTFKPFEPRNNVVLELPHYWYRIGKWLLCWSILQHNKKHKTKPWCPRQLCARMFSCVVKNDCWISKCQKLEVCLMIIKVALSDVDEVNMVWPWVLCTMSAENVSFVLKEDEKWQPSVGALRKEEKERSCRCPLKWRQTLMHRNSREN